MSSSSDAFFHTTGHKRNALELNRIIRNRENRFRSARCTPPGRSKKLLKKKQTQLADFAKHFCPQKKQRRNTSTTSIAASYVTIRQDHAPTGRMACAQASSFYLSSLEPVVRHISHRPYRLCTWPRSLKPYFSAISRCSVSMRGSQISTIFPHCRQTRWS